MLVVSVRNTMETYEGNWCGNRTNVCMAASMDNLGRGTGSWWLNMTETRAHRANGSRDGGEGY